MPSPKNLIPEIDQSIQLLSIVDRLVAEVRPGGRPNVELDSQLERDLGLDSLARVELLARIEQAFGVRLDDAVLGSAETPRDLLVAVAASAPVATAGESLPASWPAPQPVDEGLPDNAATLVEVLHWHAARHPQRPHVMFQRSATETDTMDYGQLLAYAQGIFIFK